MHVHTNKFPHLQSVLIGIVVACIAAVVMVAYVLQDIPQLPTTLFAAKSSTHGTSTLPVRLSIPALNIDANIQQVGRTSAGLMGSPSNFKDVAWFNMGPQPGEVGSAVITGHVNNPLGLSGVFKDLATLKVGDEVIVETESKKLLRFEVVGIEEYPYDQVPLDTLLEKKDGAYLNLVTCAGTWLRDRKTYDRRIVVFTKYVSDKVL